MRPVTIFICAKAGPATTCNRQHSNPIFTYRVILNFLIFTFYLITYDKLTPTCIGISIYPFSGTIPSGSSAPAYRFWW